jgi:Tfp pilus assembly protein PilN
MAAALLLAVLLAPYLEALLFQPALARRLAALKSESEQLAVIDRELSFLQFLEQNQSPHVDAVYVVANAIPQGSRIETMNLSRQGEVSLTGWLRDPNQLGEFRLQLINSGFFSTVVVEDQSPTPDRQRINFRITARWKDATERAALKLSPVTPDSVQAKSKSTNSSPLSPQPNAAVPPPPR